jgi:hypothetical protein
VIMVCGEDLYRFWELEAIMNDVGWTNESGEYPQRRQELGSRGQPSGYMKGIFTHNHMMKRGRLPIWSLLSSFGRYYCSDPRDRVYGLLALADSESREAFNPDYTKSVAEVFLQLVEHRVKIDNEDDSWESIHNFYWAHNIVCAFRFGPDNPDIAAMHFATPLRPGINGHYPSGKPIHGPPLVDCHRIHYQTRT